MAGPYYVDDGGNDTTGLTWGNAFTSINSLLAGITLASDEIVYFGADSQCQATNSASLTITGPTSGNPVKLISATVGTTTYAKGTGNQIDTSEAASYNVTFDGSIALYGLRVKAGKNVSISQDIDETFSTSDCTFAIGNTGSVQFTGSVGTTGSHTNMTVDLTADGTTQRTTTVFSHLISSTNYIHDIEFINAGYRTGTVTSGTPSSGVIYMSGIDLTGFTNATTCEIVNAAGIVGKLVIHNSKTAETWTPFSGAAAGGCEISLYNTGPADSPTSLITSEYFGGLISSSAIYRTGGAVIEGDATAWLITTTSACSEAGPFSSPWIYDALTTTGSKTFTIYLTNDSIAFNDSEVWMELDYFGTSNDPRWSRASSRRATITTTPAYLTSDGTSTWNGSGPSFTYRRQVSVTVTIGEEGQYRARLVVARASVPSSAYLYVDPKVVVS